MMQVIESVKDMQEFSVAAKRRGNVIGLVPTMGYLHEGHASLMVEGRKLSDLLVASIFVNPTQFGIGEDFENYPRNMDNDLAIASDSGVDVIFAPKAGDIYPDGFQTYVNTEKAHTAALWRQSPRAFSRRNDCCCQTLQYGSSRYSSLWQKGFPATRCYS